MANFTRKGYGQVEFNQFPAQKTGEIFASLPLDPQVTVLENGTFMYYDYATNKVTATPSFEGQEPYLVYNEVKLYQSFETQKDFALIKVGSNYVTTGMVTEEMQAGPASAKIDHPGSTYRLTDYAPRLYKTNIGAIYTTNMVDLKGEGSGVTYQVKDLLEPTLDSEKHVLVLKKVEAASKSGVTTWQVVKVYTMPDGQPALKLMRVQ